MGALEKLIKVYGETRAIAEGADKTNEKIDTFTAKLNSWDNVLKEESTFEVIKAIAAQDIPNLIAKLETFVLAPVPPIVAAPTTVRPPSINGTGNEEAIRTFVDDEILDVSGDDPMDQPQVDPQLLRLTEYVDDLIDLIEGAQAHVNRTHTLEERLRTSDNENAALKRGVVSNTNFINSQRSKLELFNLDDMKSRIAEIERKVSNFPRHD